MCEYLPAASWEVSFEPGAVREARMFLTEHVCPVHGFARLDEARVVVSELVTNGVQHGAPPIVVTVECLGETGTRVSVTDTDPDPDIRPQEIDPTAESGRGVMLVDHISQAWGVISSPTGKEVWALI